MKSDNSNSKELVKQIFEAYSLIRLTSIDAMLGEEKDARRYELDRFCEKLSSLMVSIATKLNATYFRHSTYQYQGAKGGFQVEV